ncbi:unnamed protein product [Cyprideis torosa]|uniref:Uncharacterized protein n=1 Tax=Cyprideis torosa TaxID=163714 RepID=A0A7R8W149_9CRUS|nr:unnamed protein product [Cyprideis torosa]CAG0879429.1 unnamed protein product [Cyprideis torosa]
MSRFLALNEAESSGSDSEEDVLTEEAQEGRARSLYSEGLQLLVAGRAVEAEYRFLDVLQSCPQKVSLTSVRYGVFQNLGSLYSRRNENEAAFRMYLHALSVDNTDPMLWYRLGTVAEKFKEYHKAGKAYKEVLRLNPRHWPSIDRLIPIMLYLSDTCGAQDMIEYALELDPTYAKALELKALLKENPFHPGPIPRPELPLSKAVYAPEVAVIKLGDTPEPHDELWTWAFLFGRLIDVMEAHSFNAKIDLRDLVVTLSAKNSSAIEAMEVEASIDRSEGFASTQEGDCIKKDVEDGAEAKTEDCEQTPAAGVAREEARSGSGTGSSTPTTGGAGSSRLPRELLRLESWGFVKRRSSRANNLSNSVVNSPARSNSVSESGGAGTPLTDALRSYLPRDILQRLQAEDDDEDTCKQSTDSSFGRKVDSGDNRDEALEATAQTASESNSRQFPDDDAQEKEVCAFLSDLASRVPAPALHCLLFLVVSRLSWRDRLEWPHELKKAYLKGYAVLREHYIQSDYCLLPAKPQVLENVQMTMVNAELATDLARSIQRGIVTDENLDSLIAPNLEGEACSREFQMDLDLFNTLLLVLGAGEEDTVEDVENEDERPAEVFVPGFKKSWTRWKVEIRLRIFALKARLSLLEEDQTETLDCLAKAKRWIEENPKALSDFSLPYLENESYLQLDVIQQEHDSLSRFESIDHVRELYRCGNYSDVASLLFDLLLGPTVGTTGANLPHRPLLVKLLIDSLYLSNRYSDLLGNGGKILSDLLNRRSNQTSPSASAQTVTESTMDRAIVFALETFELCTREAPNVLKSLSNKQLGDLARELIRIIVMNMEAIDNKADPPLQSVEPWILLSQVVAARETTPASSAAKADETEEEDDEEDDREIPSSLKILVDAHEWLGRRDMCSMCGGKLLRHFVETAPLHIIQKNKDLQLSFEQSVSCLYGHPQSRKGRGRALEDHGAKEQPLTWERSPCVFAYFRPPEIPDFDSNRVPSITNDIECLFRRILQQLPATCDPVEHLQPLTDYIEGRTDVPPSNRPPTPPPEADNDHQTTIWMLTDIYYFLADHYMKRKDFSKASKYYELDIIMNPSRFDSWAGLAMAKTGALEAKLNSCQPIKQDGEIFKRTDEALRCFQRTLELDPRLTKVWIEYGSLAYAMHSYGSRELKQEPSMTDCSGMEMFQKISELEKRKKDFLDKSYSCFLKAKEILDKDKTGDEDDGWLIHFMLGKIKEKLHFSLSESLDHYQRASRFLEESNASYPKRINYNDPAVLALESLEVYYRIHAAVLKYILSHMDEEISIEEVEMMKLVLWQQSHSSFARGVRDGEGTWVSRDIIWDIVQKAEQKIKSQQERDEVKLAFFGQDVAESGKGKAKQVKPLGRSLIGVMKTCLKALTLTYKRFPQHYKSSHLLAKFYATAPAPFRNIPHCKDLLLGKPGEIAQTKKSEGIGSGSAPGSPATAGLFEDRRTLTDNLPLVHVAGLFRERKKFNFFNGIWRIPSTDIDRPGSFASHMRSCIALLMEVLYEVKDFSSLMTVSTALHTKPEADKMYLFENERKALSAACFEKGMLILRRKVQKGTGNTKALLMEVYRAYIRVEKAFHGKRSAELATLIVDLYSQLDPEGVKTLDAAINYCQLHTETKNPSRKRKDAFPPQTIAGGSISIQPIRAGGAVDVPVSVPSVIGGVPSSLLPPYSYSDLVKQFQQQQETTMASRKTVRNPMAPKRPRGRPPKQFSPNRRFSPTRSLPVPSPILAPRINTPPKPNHPSPSTFATPIVSPHRMSSARELDAFIRACSLTPPIRPISSEANSGLDLSRRSSNQTSPVPPSSEALPTISPEQAKALVKQKLLSSLTKAHDLSLKHTQEMIAKQSSSITITPTSQPPTLPSGIKVNSSSAGSVTVSPTPPSTTIKSLPRPPTPIVRNSPSVRPAPPQTSTSVTRTLASTTTPTSSTTRSVSASSTVRPSKSLPQKACPSSASTKVSSSTTSATKRPYSTTVSSMYALLTKQMENEKRMKTSNDSASNDQDVVIDLTTKETSRRSYDKHILPHVAARLEGRGVQIAPVSSFKSKSSIPAILSSSSDIEVICLDDPLDISGMIPKKKSDDDEIILLD